MDTELIDQLFLELTQVTNAVTEDEIDYIRALFWVSEVFDTKDAPDHVWDAIRKARSAYEVLPSRLK